MALIEETNNVRRNLQTTGKEVLALLNRYLMESIIRGTAIIVSIESEIVNCLNTIYISDYTIDKDHFYMSYENFELDIKFDDQTDVTYEEEYEKCFTFVKTDYIIKLFV